MVLKIVNWNSLYENNRTRDLKRMEWVPVPNRMDGDGYTELLDHKNGAAHYGAWMAMVLVASKCGVRGTLLRESAEPHTSESLARISRISKNVFDEAIPRLVKIGWLRVEAQQNESDRTSPQEGAAKPQDVAPECLWNGTEWNGTERNGTLTRQAADREWVRRVDEVFENQVWPNSWKPSGKKTAHRAFVKAAIDEQTVVRIVEGMSAQIPYMLKRDMQYRPLLSTWLNQNRWEDDPKSLMPSREGLQQRMAEKAVHHDLMVNAIAERMGQ